MKTNENGVRDLPPQIPVNSQLISASSPLISANTPLTRAARMHLTFHGIPPKVQTLIQHVGEPSRTDYPSLGFLCPMWKI